MFQYLWNWAKKAASHSCSEAKTLLASLHENSDWGRQQGKQYRALGSKKDKLAKKPKWRCPICGDSLFNSEEIETHHIEPVKDGGGDDAENLIHLHRACHIHVALAKTLLAKAT